MTPEFRQGLESRLRDFRAWAGDRPFSLCRLVQYTGIECLGAIDVPLEEVDSEIAGAVCEGFGIDWQERQGTLYLVVWEPEGLPWTWAHVFAEAHLDDIDRFQPPPE